MINNFSIPISQSIMDCPICGYHGQIISECPNCGAVVDNVVPEALKPAPVVSDMELELVHAEEARVNGDLEDALGIVWRVVDSDYTNPLVKRFNELYGELLGKIIDRFEEILGDDSWEANRLLSSYTISLKSIRNAEKTPRQERFGNILSDSLRKRLKKAWNTIEELAGNSVTMQALFVQAQDLLGFKDYWLFTMYLNPAKAMQELTMNAAQGQSINPDGDIGKVIEMNNLKDPELNEWLRTKFLTQLSAIDVQKKLDAWRLFSYIGGKSPLSLDNRWPQYGPSFRTSDACKAARLVSDSLRQDFLPIFLSVYRFLHDDDRTTLLTVVDLLDDSGNEKLVKEWLKNVSIPKVTCFHFSSDGKYFATGYTDGKVKLYDGKNWKLLHEYVQHKSVVKNIAFSPDGGTLISLSEDGEILIKKVK